MKDFTASLPDLEELKTQVELLRGDLASLFLEIDDLRSHVCWQIEADYRLKLGTLEYELSSENVELQRTRRKIMLIQVAINRQEPIRIEEIDAILNDEFESYQRKLRKEGEKLHEAIHYLHAYELTNYETTKLKKLYFRIVKKLHPDIHPNATAQQKKLLESAVNAYENGDLAAMENLDLILKDLCQEGKNEEETREQLFEQRNQLTLHRQNMIDEIKKIKENYPYAIKDLLQDEEWVSNTRESLAANIKDLKEKREMAESHLRQLLDENKEKII